MPGAVVFLLAYLVGAIPSGLVVGRLRAGVDVREHGSGGTGATNVLRSVGPAAALLVLLLDVAKGLLAVWLAARFAPAGVAVETAALLAAAGVVVGHVWPVFAGFSGGKGVATAAGAFLALDPLACAIGVAVFVVVLAVTRVVSLSSLAAVLLLPGVLGALDVLSVHDVSYGLLGYAAGLAALVLLTHRTNVRRVADGSEPKIGR
jgi:glycerol-3-phosphate acyltransferase PlsY